VLDQFASVPLARADACPWETGSTSEAAGAGTAGVSSATAQTVTMAAKLTNAASGNTGAVSVCRG